MGEPRVPGDPAALDYAGVFDALPTPYIILSRELVVLDVNSAFAAGIGRSRAELVGRFLFEAFPPAEGAANRDGMSAIQVAMERVRDTGRAEALPIQRYPLVSKDGQVSDRYWLILGAPLRDGHGAVVAVIQRAEDVTGLITGHADPARTAEDDSWRRRAEQVEAELYIHARQLAAAQAAKDAAARQLASLAEVALALTSAGSVEDLEEIVVGRGLTVLGADGGAVVSRAENGDWRITVNDAFGERLRMRYGSAPYDSALPACWTARTGERLLLPDRAAGLAFHPVMAEVYADTGRQGWAFLPLQIQGEQLGSLAVSWAEERRFSATELGLLDGFAAQCAQALRRIQTADLQRVAARRMQDLAEALQQALLTPPPQSDHLHVVVRYRPADDVAQVGGDWYDAFIQPDGATMLVIGDVVGHDSVAAARMGQLRGLLRALAYAAEADPHADTPAAILTRVEHAARGLSVDTLATAVLARIERVPDDPLTGHRTLRWSNAGHPPPVLLERDGTVTVLDPPPNLMLGVNPDAPRQDHTLALPDGATLLLYTDGLIERRTASLEEGMADLRDALAGHAVTPLDELCDAILAALAPHTGDDDIALVAVRTYPDNQPRPAEAGPSRTPADQPDR